MGAVSIVRRMKDGNKSLRSSMRRKNSLTPSDDNGGANTANAASTANTTSTTSDVPSALSSPPADGSAVSDSGTEYSMKDLASVKFGHGDFSKVVPLSSLPSPLSSLVSRLSARVSYLASRVSSFYGVLTSPSLLYFLHSFLSLHTGRQPQSPRTSLRVQNRRNDTHEERRNSRIHERN
jgi:hypothetical protein